MSVTLNGTTLIGAHGVRGEGVEADKKKGNKIVHHVFEVS